MNKMLHIAAKCGKSWPDIFEKYTLLIRFRQHRILYVIDELAYMNPGQTF